MNLVKFHEQKAENKITATIRKKKRIYSYKVIYEQTHITENQTDAMNAQIIEEQRKVVDSCAFIPKSNSQ